MKPDNVNSQLYMLEGAKSIGAGAATIALAGAAVGIGNVLSSSIHSVARNPSLAKQSFGYAILGFALTEAIALFAPMMAFLISFVFRSHKKKGQFKLKEVSIFANRDTEAHPKQGVGERRVGNGRASFMVRIHIGPTLLIHADHHPFWCV